MIVFRGILNLKYSNGIERMFVYPDLYPQGNGIYTDLEGLVCLKS